MVSMDMDGMALPSPLIWYLTPLYLPFSKCVSFIPFSETPHSPHTSNTQKHGAFACVDFPFCEMPEVSTTIFLHVYDSYFLEPSLPNHTPVLCLILTHPLNLSLSGPFLELGSTDLVKLPSKHLTCL